MGKQLAKIISIIFHPVLIPTLGMFLLLNSGFYFELLLWEAKRFVLLVVFFTTCILPMLSVAILSLNPNFNVNMPNNRDRVIPLLSASVFYYLGFILLKKVQAVPEFKVFMLASVLVLVALLVISLKWKISNHMAAIGGLAGTLFALSFRHGINPIYSILIVVLLSGLIGTARLILGKHSLLELIAGYGLGFSVLYLVIYFA
ncbi:phosphatase PAP2 family protein [Draconibacterium sp. IB214405]|uniref:phosphatase PAP2 family protein n=1 Tax=Draconibacterium sp. IB214405 TaxID=3097352 RepID=UPI002A10A2FC|nr:phosphatase PAP2 family protein [Draconibacterium sp. IB214405]MDX8338148.1 phosphatase PAP2 family protein [Draconibacterium sp. IB214405]